MTHFPQSNRSSRRGLVLLALVLAAAVAMFLLLRPAEVEPPPPGAAAQDTPGPVLLVPGYGGGTGSLERLASMLQAAGRSATVVQVPNGGTGDIREAAAALDAAADAAIAAGAPSVDVVGYSAGGVIARSWADGAGATKARRVVTLGSPHHGSQVAELASRFSGQNCPVACQQLVPGSSLLDDLNDGDETPGGPVWVSVWTEADETVTPPESSRLEGALNVPVQSLCPGSSLPHGELPTDPTVFTLVLAALGPAAEITLPTVCAG